MPQFNVQMITNILSSALTATVASWLSYLAAWSHFSTTDNTALATVIAAGLAIMIGQILTIAINRYSVLVDRVAQGGTKVVLPDQKAADSAPNPNVVGPADMKVTKAVVAVLAAGLSLFILMPGDAYAQPKLPLKPAQFTGNIVKDLGANNPIANLPQLKPPGEVLSDLDKALAAIDLILQSDLETAIKVFDAAGNDNGKACFAALLEVVKANAAANAAVAAADQSAPPAPAAPPAGSSTIADKLPIRNAFTRLAQIYNLMVANQPGAPIKQQCAAMKQDFGNAPLPSALLNSSVIGKVMPVLKLIGFGA